MLCAVGMVEDVVDVPSETDGSGTVTVAPWNIRTGRAGGLECALRVAKTLEVDIILLKETKLMQGIYTRRTRGVYGPRHRCCLASPGGSRTMHEAE